MNRFYPFFAENFLLPLYDVMRGASRFKSSRVLQRTQWFSRERIERLQFRNLRVLLKHAYETVPYYRRVFRDRGLSPNDIRSVDHLVKLPILTKANIRENFVNLAYHLPQRPNLKLRKRSATLSFSENLTKSVPS